MGKYKLTLDERFTLMGMLPKEGSYVTLGVLRECSSSLGLKDSEFKEYEVVQDGVKVSWNPTKGLVEKEIEIGEYVETLFIEQLTKLDTEEKLPLEKHSLYEKFVKKGGN